MASDSLVSVIIPVFNRAEFISDAIDSVVMQSYSNWELLLVDDGSTDSTGEICRNYSQLDQRIRYFFRENGGAYAARNLGLKFAKGDYVAFLDSDDLWLSDHLKSTVAILDDYSDVDIVFCALKRIDYLSGKVIVKNSFYNDEGKHPILTLSTLGRGSARLIADHRFYEYIIKFGTPCGLHCMLFRQKVFKDFSFDERFRTVWDRISFILFVFRGFKFSYIETISLVYRVHHSNISTVSGEDGFLKKEKSALTLISAYSSLFEYLDSLSNIYKNIIKEKISQYYAWYLSCLYLDNHQYLKSLNSVFSAIFYDFTNIRYYKLFFSTLVKIFFSKIRRGGIQ